MHKTLIALTLVLSTAFATLSDITLSTTTALPVTSGIVINGATGTKIGNKVADAGDFNADGFKDYLVAGSGTAGNKVYVVLGKSAARSAALELTGVTTTDVYTITLNTGASNVASAVSAIANVGDINGDGVNDIAIGDSSHNAVYVLYGKFAGATGPPALTATWTTWADLTIDTTTTNSAKVLKITGAANTKFGESVAGGGDLNGDQKDDLLIGASDWVPASGADAQGAVCVVWGRVLLATVSGASTSAGRGADPVECSTQALLTTNSVPTTNVNEGILITGAAKDKLGNSVAFVGDMNGDSKRDIIIGAAATGATDGKGKAYIVYGPGAATTTAIDLSSTTTPLPYTKVIGPASSSGSFGSVVNGAGDFNNDQKSDAVIGHPSYDSATKNDLGQVYVLFATTPASAGASLAEIDFSAATAVAATRAITITGGVENGYFGADVDGAGDVNADGITDLVVGAPLASGSRAAGTGRAYLIYGKANPANMDLATALTQATGIYIQGTAGSEFGTSVAGVGDVTADTIADVVVGAPAGTKTGITGGGLVYEFRGQKIDTPSNPASGFRLHASLLVLASFFVALMF